MSDTTYLKWLRDIRLTDIPTVGGKNASLGEMFRNLGALGVRVPDGFVLTVACYRAFIAHNALEPSMRELVAAMDPADVESVRRTGIGIRTLIGNGGMPGVVLDHIEAGHAELCRRYGRDAIDMAVRSSATAEDLPEASFAGQQETFLNVRGTSGLALAVRNCFASLWTDRAITYRHGLGLDHFQVGISAGVQKMVRSDLAVSGVAFSLDTESGLKDVVLINASYGLGELVVQGAVSPDELLVFKPTLAKGHMAVIDRKPGGKDRRMVYGAGPGEPTRIIPNDEAMRERACITDALAMDIARNVVSIEQYYSGLKGSWCPMDVEWAVDGESGELFIVQARPETVHSRMDAGRLVEYKLQPAGHERLLVSGIAVGAGVGQGRVRILSGADSTAGDIEQGEVLVADMTDPDWEPLMRKACAIITNRGGRTCHAAIVARELGVPAIVGCGNATELLRTGVEVTASCCEGVTGHVFEGRVPFTREETLLADLPPVRTPIMLNVASPEKAFSLAALPNAGVGLVREEFIITDQIKAHPLALLRHRELGDAELDRSIEQLIKGHADGRSFFVERLSQGIARIAAAFFPARVIVRFSDLKSNEYRGLLGGRHFEPDEENPMIGWRGASRYYSEAYREAFGLECKAIRRVREEMGLKNVVVMVPFCRTVEELRKVLSVMREHGLERGRDGLELYLMAEIPSNIILAEQFAPYIDGFSIGSNDLTQLTLGLDRDSALVAHLYDERDPAVKDMLRRLIESARRTGTKVGICGQGPSDFPDFAQFLVELGIDTISVSPDSLLRTRRAIAEVEARIAERKAGAVARR